MPDVLRVTRSCAIGVDEIRFRFSASGGPGGQHANRSQTRVEATFDIASSPSLGPRQRARLQRLIGDVLRVVADDERSQTRNRALAVERLRTRLADALHEDRPRRPTQPTAGARKRRLETKRKRSELKRSRRPPAAGDAP